MKKTASSKKKSQIKVQDIKPTKNPKGGVSVKYTRILK